MDEKEELNLTLPVILIGLIAIGVFVFFFVSGEGEEFLNSERGETIKKSLGASSYHFIAPDRVREGEVATFSWKADVQKGAVCVGKTEPEGSDGGWIGTKDTEGEQDVGPILLNTTYFLDCTDGEKMVRDVELVSVLQPSVSFTSNKSEVNYGDAADPSWDAIHVLSCSLSDGSAELATGLNGSYQTGELTETVEYMLDCETDTELISRKIEIVVIK